MTITITGGITLNGGGWSVSAPPPPGQQAYTTPGTYIWTAPADIYSVSVVCIGGGGSGAYANTYAGGAWPSGGGGGLGWKNNIPVVPGETYTVVVGAGTPAITLPSGGVSRSYPSTPAGDSYFISTSTVKGGAGGNASADGPGQGGTYVGDGGGNGGNGAVAGGGTEGSSATGAAGGGGAGGYSGNGGNARSTIATSGARGDPYGTGYPGNGGGGGAGAGYSVPAYNNGMQLGACGGGTGILGEGSSGAGGISSTNNNSCQGGGGGSGGTAGSSASQFAIPGSGGLYGGGGGAFLVDQYYYGDKITYAGGGGAVRIIWGTGRAFPSTNTGDV